MSQEFPFNIYAKDCPSRVFFERLSDKWSMLIIGLLVQETKRFNQLKREVEGISQKVLSQKLKQLERDGLVHREVQATVPVTVEYSLTPLGVSFTGIIDEMKVWAEGNVMQMLEAQREYDLANA